MLEDYLEDKVNDYINNEINYIRRKEDCTSLDNYDIDDLYKLQNMEYKDIKEIVNAIAEDSELEEKINELIHYYLYH